MGGVNVFAIAGDLLSEAKKKHGSDAEAALQFLAEIESEAEEHCEEAKGDGYHGVAAVYDAFRAAAEFAAGSVRADAEVAKQ